MMSTNRQIPILIERLQHLSEACIKKEELIKTQGEYMQESENQIYELQLELQEKDWLIRELNTTISEQREYLDNKYLGENSQIDNSWDFSLDNQRITSKNKNKLSIIINDDKETIEELREDIKQLLKEYKLIEKQKDEMEEKLTKKNNELIMELTNMEKVIEDQDIQIMNMRERLQNQMKELAQSQALSKNLNIIQSQFEKNLDVTDTELDRSANISQQINLENFKAGRIGGRLQNNKNKIDKKALNDVLNLSFQVNNY
jgi:chromosome segregation ATPase